MHSKANTLLPPPARIGIIGGGQLGKMLAYDAKRMGYHVTVLDPTPGAPAAQVCDAQVVASFMDKEAIQKLAESCQVLTFEFEHIDADMLVALEEKGHRIYPSGKTLKKIQDKYIQKEILQQAGLTVPQFMALESKADAQSCVARLGLPLILKTRKGGYDGKGNCVVHTEEELLQAMDAFHGLPLMAEAFISFEREVSMMVARALDGSIALYPVAENLHEESILRLTMAPAVLEAGVEKKVREMCTQVLALLDDYGVFCIEMFLTPSGEVYINEIAPRPHNSGHYTIEACVTSQFEQLLRVITGLPLGSVRQRIPAVMANILGSEAVEGAYTFEGVEVVLAMEDVHLHVYGKHSTKKLKKIGHVTVLHPQLQEAKMKAMQVIQNLKFRKREVGM